MSTNYKVAKRYARALWLLAEDEKSPAQTAQEWNETLLSLAAQLKATPTLGKVLSSASVNPEQKWGILKDVLAQMKAAKGIERFLEQCARAGRLAALPEISQAFARLVNEATGVAEVLVESAIDLSSEELGRIGAQIEKYTAKKAKITFKKDTALLAGFKISVAGKTFDATLANNLQRMKKQLLMAEA